MPLISWDSSLSVDVVEMDSQHQVLINIINQLHETMRVGKGAMEVGNSITKMIAYANEHFQNEERFLQANNYPGLLKQKSEHAAFMAKAHEFERLAKAGQITMSMAVSTYLQTWLTSHIQGEDKQYGKYLKGKVSK